MSRALEWMKRYNEHALVGMVDGIAVMIEDVLIEVPQLMARTDGRSPYFRLEVQADPTGKRAVAYIRHNPWASHGQGPNAGCDHRYCHINGTSGEICIGPKHHSGGVKESDYDLDFVIPRARYLCLAFCSYKLTGEFPQL